MTQHAAVHPSEQRPPSPPPHRSPCASYFEPALTTVDTQESADSSSHGSSARLSVASDLSSSLRSRFSLSGFRSYRLNHRRSTSPSRKNTVSWRPDPPERTIITPPGDDDTGEDQGRINNIDNKNKMWGTGLHASAEPSRLTTLFCSQWCIPTAVLASFTTVPSIAKLDTPAIHRLSCPAVQARG